jgi:hypothetical protein
VIEKHFGMDDGDPSPWKPEKRRAYGGVYRYQCITFIQRQGNWNAACVLHFRKALKSTLHLALDLDFFYELHWVISQWGIAASLHYKILTTKAVSIYRNWY